MPRTSRKSVRNLFLILPALALSLSVRASSPDDTVTDALNEAIQDEYRSQATYQKVIDTFGEVRPFSNIIEAEARHIQELSALFEARGLEVPVSRWSSENVPSYGSVLEACTAGVRLELENIAMYDRLLSIELPADVRRTFEYLRAASNDNHLPAFRRCVERERS